jgi:cation diffusion facilitator family transporter
LAAVRIGIIGLTLTAVVQAALVALTGSVALLADTAHNGIDVIATVIVGLAFMATRRKRTARFAFGLHRAEDLAGLVVIALIGLTAGIVTYESIMGLRNGTQVSHPWVVLAAGLVGFVGNEAVAHYKIAVGRKIDSAALVADGIHSRADGLTSLAVVAAGIGVLVGVGWVDSVAGLLVAAVIAWAGYGPAREVIVRLLDGADLMLVESLTAQTVGIPLVEHVNDLRVRHAGRTVQVVASVCMPAELSLRQAHDAAESLRDQWLHSLPSGSTVDVHVDPYVPGEFVPHPADAG